jgi:hypothetical protein
MHANIDFNNSYSEIYTGVPLAISYREIIHKLNPAVISSVTAIDSYRWMGWIIKRELLGYVLANMGNYTNEQ